MSAQSFGPFRIEILGGMDIDGDPRTGVFLSADIPQLRGVGAMMGDDVGIVRADVVQALSDALRQIEQCDEDGIDVHSPQDLARAALRAIEGGWE